jgi:hypothetical protein
VVVSSQEPTSSGSAAPSITQAASGIRNAHQEGGRFSAISSVMLLMSAILAVFI